MSERSEETPTLKQLLGSLILGAAQPLTLGELRRHLSDVAKEYEGHTAVFAKVREKELRSALDELSADIAGACVGFHLVEVAGGFKLQTDAAAGPWLRLLLNTGKPYRLSRPALETLAIIAYRQPVTRGDIEAVRGVNVDHIMRLLMEMQLVRIAGRSELPGRPMLYGTTKLFLEHFGMNTISELPGVAELSRVHKDQPELPMDMGAANEEESPVADDDEEDDKS
jgi:segregation and condensation protein B